MAFAYRYLIPSTNNFDTRTAGYCNPLEPPRSQKYTTFWGSIFSRTGILKPAYTAVCQERVLSVKVHYGLFACERISRVTDKMTLSYRFTPPGTKMGPWRFYYNPHCRISPRIRRTRILKVNILKKTFVPSYKKHPKIIKNRG